MPKGQSRERESEVGGPPVARRVVDDLQARERRLALQQETLKASNALESFRFGFDLKRGMRSCKADGPLRPSSMAWAKREARFVSNTTTP